MLINRLDVTGSIKKKVVFSVLDFEISNTFLTDKINSCDEKDDDFSHADDSRVIVSRRFLQNSIAVSRSGSVNEISGMQGH